MNDPKRKLATNPGGQLAPNEIFGRDEHIEKYWGILDGRSIYMNDLRRIGKTQIMVKMKAEPMSGWHPVKRDLGGLHSAAEFATRAYLDAAEVLGTKERTFRGVKSLLGKMAGAEVAGVLKLPGGEIAPWKEVLFRTFADIEDAMTTLSSETARVERMVFLWDEVPFLLENIAKRDGSQVAMEVLDALRAFGQDHDHVRLLLTGSIGLYHILAELRGEKYNNSPLNRMEQVQPGPLGEGDGSQLAKALLQGTGLKCDQPDQCAKLLANRVGHVAFFIHNLVSRLPLDGPLTEEVIERSLNRELVDDENDDWDFAHYRTRLRRYYGPRESLALTVLDEAATGAPVDFDSLRGVVAAKHSDAEDDEQLRELLKLLCRDHYLVRTESGYRFYLELIRRWWCIDRSL